MSNILKANYIETILRGKMNPTIEIIPESPLFDKPVEIVFSNLIPQTHIRVDCCLKDDKGNPWYSSYATFKANDTGIVNIAKDAPISGTYKDVDAMGLIWSMRPVDMTEEHDRINGNENKIYFKVSIHNTIKNNIHDKIILEKSIFRKFAAENIEKRLVFEEGLVGVLCYPKDKRNLSGIITVSGSNGGYSEALAEILASNGYAVFALGYFGKEGLPQNLENISLEYFHKAIQWLKKQPQINKNNIILRGPSRGGELVLLLASMFPEEINGVIAIVPSSMLIGGFPYPNRPAWCYNNIPLAPFLPALTSDDPDITEGEDLKNSMNRELIPYHAGTYEDPFVINDLFLARIHKNQNILEDITIPVEKIRCPILLISGENDLVHPSFYHCNRIMERLDKMKSPIERKHLHFSNAGHSLRTPFEPKIDLPGNFGDFWGWSGGTIEGNAQASRIAWEETLNFFKGKKES